MWKTYGIICSFLIAISRILRKWLYKYNSISFNNGWLFIIIGILLGLVFEFLNYYNVKTIKNTDFAPKMLFVLSGLLIVATMKLFNKALFICKHPGWISALYAGLSTIITYLGVVIFLNETINITKIIGVILTVIGITAILV